MSFEDALSTLKKNFQLYINEEVLSQVKCKNMDIYYTGLPDHEFKDFTKLVSYVTNGELLKTIASQEANETILRYNKKLYLKLFDFQF